MHYYLRDLSNRVSIRLLLFVWLFSRRIFNYSCQITPNSHDLHVITVLVLLYFLMSSTLIWLPSTRNSLPLYIHKSCWQPVSLGHLFLLFHTYSSWSLQFPCTLSFPTFERVQEVSRVREHYSSLLLLPTMVLTWKRTPVYVERSSLV